MSKRDLYREIAASSLVVYPAIFPEVSCISALEAAACGTPMVASRYAALKETVADRETGLLVPGDPHSEEYQTEFAAAVAGLLADEARLAEMRHAARSRVEARFQWRDIAAEWEALFDELQGGQDGKRRDNGQGVVVELGDRERVDREAAQRP